MLMGRIHLACISQGSAQYWSIEIRNAVLAINTRCVRVDGYTPAEILLGFNPSTTRRVELGFDQWVKQQNQMSNAESEEPEETHINSYIDEREERSLMAGQKLARLQDKLKSRKSPGYQKPKAGDLALVRDFQLAKDRGRKLDARWSTPRLLDRLSHSGVSGHVHQLHEPPGKTKRYHLDDLLLYIPRDSHYPTSSTDGSMGEKAVEYERGAMGEVQGIWGVGQRAFDLGDLG